MVSFGMASPLASRSSMSQVYPLKTRKSAKKRAGVLPLSFFLLVTFGRLSRFLPLLYFPFRPARPLRCRNLPFGCSRHRPLLPPKLLCVSAERISRELTQSRNRIIQLLHFVYGPHPFQVQVLHYPGEIRHSSPSSVVNCLTAKPVHTTHLGYLLETTIRPSVDSLC